MLCAVVAMSRNRVIGRDGGLPWHLPADLRHFRELTLGHPILMGRATYDSIGRPLPGRDNLLLTRRPRHCPPGVICVRSLDEAIGHAADRDLMIIGGAQVFAATLDLCQRLYLTCVHADLPGDTFLPPLEPAGWRETARSDHAPDERHAYGYSFVTLERVRGAAG